MAKSNLAKQEQGAIAPASDVRPWAMEGEDSSDFVIPRVTIHQGDISEAKYGPGEKGSFIDTVSKLPIPSRRFAAILGWKEFIRWGAEIGDPMVYRTRNRADVPKEDLEWIKGADGKDVPPACETFRNFAVIFEGQTTPMVLSLKESSKDQRNAAKMLNHLEKTRAVGGMTCGLYELSSVDRANTKQQKWKDWVVTPVGNASPDLAALVSRWQKEFAGRTVQTNVEGEAAPAGDYNPDNDA